MIARAAFLASVSLVLVACGGTSDVTIAPEAPPAGPAGNTPTTSPSTTDAGWTLDAGLDATVDPGPTPPAVDGGLDAGVDGSTAPDGGDLVGGLIGLTSTCVPASNGTYATDRSSTAMVPICKLNGGFFWQADLAIDCDGQKTTACNAKTDATYSGQTSFSQSNGQPLIASQLPFVVIPLPSGRFDYRAQDIQPGAVAIVLYGGKVSFGVFGDEGPAGVIGEASYAMAQSLGIDPDPKTGGTSGPVTYFVLTGKSAVVSPIEDHAAAATLGATLALDLIANN